MKYILLGLYFTILQLLIIILHVQSSELFSIVWFCNNAPGFLAIGFFCKAFQLIKGIISLGIIAQFGWAVDVIYTSITGTALFGFTTYVFALTSWKLYLTVMVHFLSLSVALLYTYKIPTLRESILYGMGYGLLLHMATLLLTPSTKNINCGFTLCGSLDVAIPGYMLLYPFLILGVLVIPGYYLQKVLQKV